MARRAAYFLLLSDYFGRAFDDGIYRALLDAGFEIDVYSPDGNLPQNIYPPTVRRFDVEYRAGWLRRNLKRSRWRDYDLFLGTADIPMAFAGTFGLLAGRPSAVVCDEIYLGGYEGSATRYWKPITRWAMRRADLTIITDACRIPLQREYARLPPTHRFAESPCCFSDEPVGFDRDAARAKLGIGKGEIVLSFAGRPSPGTGLDWALRVVDRLGGPFRLLVQTAGPPDPVSDALLSSLARHGRVIYRPERLEFRESLALTAAADIGIVVYTSTKPQFQAMGVSSNKLCLSLWLGIPVVATRQESFAFVETLGCGVLIDREEELTDAIETIRRDIGTFRANTARAVGEYIRAEEKRRHLANVFLGMRSAG